MQNDSSQEKEKLNHLKKQKLHSYLFIAKSDNFCGNKYIFYIIISESQNSKLCIKMYFEILL